MEEQKQKILVAVDGSKQALNAVRYVARIMDPLSTIVVLFNIENEMPEWVRDFENTPYNRSQTASVKQWALSRKKIIKAFFNEARDLLKNAGFADENIISVIRSKKVSIAQDILDESLDDYAAVVMGRSGISKLKDMLFDSFAQNLIGKIKDIPLIIVGGEEFSRSIMIAYDPKAWTPKNVNCVGSLLKSSNCDFKICHAISAKHIDEDRIKRSMEEAEKLLLRFGKPKNCICSQVIPVTKGAAIDIIEEALHEKCGTIVVGRRGLLSFYEEQIVGRFSKKILKKANQMAVWILS